jgi:hypothetical protein
MNVKYFVIKNIKTFTKKYFDFHSKYSITIKLQIAKKQKTQKLVQLAYIANECLVIVTGYPQKVVFFL